MSVADDLTISPERTLVARPGREATLSCVYKPDNSPNIIGWGVLRTGQPNYIFPNTSDRVPDSNIYYSKGGHSLIFSPVQASHAGRYYCFVAIGMDPVDDVYSHPVELVVFGKEINE